MLKGYINYKQLKDDKELKERILKSHLVVRFGNIKDCGYAAVYLAGDEASLLQE